MEQSKKNNKKQSLLNSPWPSRNENPFSVSYAACALWMSLHGQLVSMLRPADGNTLTRLRRSPAKAPVPEFSPWSCSSTQLRVNRDVLTFQSPVGISYSLFWDKLLLKGILISTLFTLLQKKKKKIGQVALIKALHLFSFKSSRHMMYPPSVSANATNHRAIRAQA